MLHLGTVVGLRLVVVGSVVLGLRWWVLMVAQVAQMVAQMVAQDQRCGGHLGRLWGPAVSASVVDQLVWCCDVW